MCFPLPRFTDIRYKHELAGGAMMDAGCCAIHCLRLFAGASRAGRARGPGRDHTA
ncbi:MAG: hypothetical protein ACM3ML_11420 [Micromonosporaceae bacterium]